MTTNVEFDTVARLRRIEEKLDVLLSRVAEPFRGSYDAGFMALYDPPEVFDRHAARDDDGEQK